MFVEILLGTVVGIAGIVIAHTHFRRKKLMKKYGDASLVDRIMKREVWEGQPEEVLIDSIGRPAAVDEKVLKTKRKEIWKYNATGKNRYSLRITVENGEVVGWDKKG